MNQRVIKFRAWDSENKRMFFLPSLYEAFWEEGAYFDYNKKEWAEKNITILQFTGLLDKNGKEIFEGDRVRHDQFSTPLIVQWDWDQWGLFDGICNEASIGKDDVEVIGNMYES